MCFYRPACADGSRPQKPEKEGAPPQCEDGNTPVSQSWNGDDGGDIEKRGRGGGQCKGNVKTLNRPSVDKDEAKREKISFIFLLSLAFFSIFHFDPGVF